MLNFLLKILFLLETLLGVELFFVALSQPFPVPGVRAGLMLLGIILTLDGLERLDGPQHGKY